MNLQSQDYLAKLLAKENLTVQHGNYQTASFDVVNRVLNLPLWADNGKDVNDLLVGHEVGHALYTPTDGWHDSEKEIPGVPRDMINIIEDIRIEKKIQETYPGITRAFKQGYKTLFDDNLFGTVGEDLSKYNFMDKLNIHSKGRGYHPVEFTETEQMFVDLAMSVDTWEDVLNACQEISDWLANREDYEEDNNEQSGEQNDNSENESTSESSSMEQGGQNDSNDEEPVENENGPEPEKSLTDQAQRENEGSLLEKNEKDKQPLYSSGISDKNLEKLTTSYAQLREQRLADPNHVYTHPALQAEFDKFLKSGINKTVNLMVKEFERKKAAWEYSRSTEAKKGSLNVNKLHQYQYSEDIFLTVNRLAQAKSHGIFMLLDFSGSMNSILSDVISQAITIALFCKRVNIPFEAYSFTTSYNENIDYDDLGDNDIENVGLLKLVQIMSSSLKKADFNESIKHLYAVAECRMRSYDSPLYYTSTCNLDGMGGTPLIQALIAIEPLINKLRANTGIQNMNTMILTDGIADSIRVVDQFKCELEGGVDIKDVRIKFRNKIIKGTNRDELTRNTLKTLGELTQSTMIGFFLAQTKHDFYYGYQLIEGSKTYTNSFKELSKTFVKTGITNFKDAAGYDDYFIVKVGKRAVEDFEIKPNKNGKETKLNDVKRQFRNFSKANKQSKQLVNKITDAVAA